MGITKADLTTDGYTAPQVIFIIYMVSFCNELTFIFIERKWLHEDNPIVDWHSNSIQVTRRDETKFNIKP